MIAEETRYSGKMTEIEIKIKYKIQTALLSNKNIKMISCMTQTNAQHSLI